MARAISGRSGAGGGNLYEAVVAHLDRLRKDGRKPVLASYSVGARERLGNLLKDHGLDGGKHADDWQAALAIADTGKSAGVALVVLPLDHGYTAPHIAVLTEQDMLGDRLIRRTKRKKSADAFLAELATLSPGDLVVHMDHGIGKYVGADLDTGRPEPATIASRWEYAGGDKLFVAGREPRGAVALRIERRGRVARPAGGRGMAAPQVEDEGAHPRDRGRN